ncbi:hypothetical protein RhiirC2_741655, partial [Rhizophagus irregularis]
MATVHLIPLISSTICIRDGRFKTSRLESILEPILNLKDSGSLRFKITFNHKNRSELRTDF